MIGEGPKATSTPNHGSLKHDKLSVLKEKQNKPLETQKLRGDKIPKISSRFNKSSLPSKENSKRRAREDTSDPQEKRRKKAIYATQIQEQRRHRLLTEGIENLELEPSVQNRDEMEEKKRLEAKRLKEKRILAHLAEQENKKKLEAESLARQSSCVKKQPNPRFDFRPRQRYNYKSSRPEIIPDGSPKMPEEEEVKPDCFVFFRYTKDELRSLNPYGYYFM